MKKECNVPVAEQIETEEINAIVTQYTLNPDGSISEMGTGQKQLTMF